MFDVFGKNIDEHLKCEIPVEYTNVKDRLADDEMGSEKKSVPFENMIKRTKKQEEERTTMANQCDNCWKLRGKYEYNTVTQKKRCSKCHEPFIPNQVCTSCLSAGLKTVEGTNEFLIKVGKWIGRQLDVENCLGTLCEIEDEMDILHQLWCEDVIDFAELNKATKKWKALQDLHDLEQKCEMINEFLSELEKESSTLPVQTGAEATEVLLALSAQIAIMMDLCQDVDDKHLLRTNLMTLTECYRELKAIVRKLFGERIGEHLECEIPKSIPMRSREVMTAIHAV